MSQFAIRSPHISVYSKGLFYFQGPILVGITDGKNVKRSHFDNYYLSKLKIYFKSVMHLN